MSNYMPQVDDVITVELPDERTRAKIVRLVSATAAIAELQSFTTASKSHNYRKGDLVPCKFGKTPSGLSGWVAVSEAELKKAERPEEVPPEPVIIREATHADIFGQVERKSKGKANAVSAG